MQNENRVLARLVAEELTDAELLEVAGGASGSGGGISRSGPYGFQDDTAPLDEK